MDKEMRQKFWDTLCSFEGKEPASDMKKLSETIKYPKFLYRYRAVSNNTMVLLGFYMLYAFQNVFDSTFYGLGKTNYMLFESVVTNSIYYGTAFILYFFGVWQPTLIDIALLFGIGNAFDAIVSLVAYAFLLKKKKINILDIE